MDSDEEEDTIYRVLKDYQLNMRRGCLYGCLTREIYEARDWIRQSLQQVLRLKAQLGRRPKANGGMVRALLEARQEECACGVVRYEHVVKELVRSAEQFLKQDPDVLLYSDLACLQDSWEQLQQILTLTSKDSQWLTFDPTSNLKGANDNRQRVDRSFSDHLCCSACEATGREYSSARRSPVLASKGRKYVPKLCIPYRIFIRSRVKPRVNGRWSVHLSDKDLSACPTSGKYRDSSDSCLLVNTDETCGCSLGGRDSRGNRSWFCRDAIQRTQGYNLLPHFRESVHRGGDGSSSNLPAVKALFPKSLTSLSMESPRSRAGSSRSGSLSPQPTMNGYPGLLGTRASPCSDLELDDPPVGPKRRRMNGDDAYTPSTLSTRSSTCDSPLSLTLNGLPDQSLDDLGLVLSASFLDRSDSNVSSPMDSPSTGPFHTQKDFRKRYKKDELWAAIKSDYNYLMDEEIIETCKSTESDLSWESDDLAINTKVSFTEFMQQCKELTDWLTHIQAVTQRQICSLSEKYLNQTYHEEMLQSSPRRKLLNDYAKQLMRRYPSMKEEVTTRIQHLNSKWSEVETDCSPCHGYQDQETMLKDLEQDLSGLRKWLHDVENFLLPLRIHVEWTTDELVAKLKEHQVLQRDIESHSKIVSAVLELCQRLQGDKQQQQQQEEESAQDNDGEFEALRVVALNLERRWHAIWLQSLEWQCRLEEAITKGKRVNRKSYPIEEEEEAWSRYSLTTTHHTIHYTNGSPHGLHEEASFLGDDDSIEFGDDGLESDTSNFDTIPFSESEYEKITVDTDVQTTDEVDAELDSAQVSPTTSNEGGKDYARDGMDQGTDSALGRSVSDDHSINADLPSLAFYHTAAAAAAAQGSAAAGQADVSQLVKKVVACATERPGEMRAAQELSGLSSSGSPTLTQHGVKSAAPKHESHDIGYSSESHSNEEADFNNGASRSIQNGERASLYTTLETVHYRTKTKGACGASPPLSGSDNLSPDHRTPDKTWRHSMTSAYDTSSNCSEPNSAYDLDTTLDASPEKPSFVPGPVEDGYHVDQIDREIQAAVHQKVSSLISSPSVNFYHMTTIEHVETDSENTSAADKLPSHADEAREGAATDAESELSKSLELPFDETPVHYDPNKSVLEGEIGSPNSCFHSTPRVKLESLFTHSQHDLPSPEQVVPSLGSSKNLVDEETSGDELAAFNLACEGHALFEMEDWLKNRAKQTDSLSVQLDSEASSREAVLNDDDLNHNLEKAQTEAIVDYSPMRKLIQQAELMVQDDDLWNLSHTKWYSSAALDRLDPSDEPGDMPPTTSTTTKAKNKESRRKRKAHFVTASESFTSTDGSVFSGGVNLSVCDASSEGSSTSGSDSETDFSTASSDGDDNYNSVILTSRSADAVLGQESSSPGSGRDASKSPRGKTSAATQADYNAKCNSVSEMHRLSNRLDTSQEYSISESAINDLRSRRSPSSSHEHLSAHKLRRTTSDTSASIPIKRTDTPTKRRRRRRMKRSTSDETSQTLSARSSPPKVIVSHSTPSSRRSSHQDRLAARSNSRSLSPCDMVPLGSSADDCRASPAEHQGAAVDGVREARVIIARGNSSRVLASDSDTDKFTGALAVPRVKVGAETVTTDDTDAVAHSVTSAVESFSEHAWDNYQDALYPSVSEDPEEEKLDASQLQGDWEHGLEYEEDFDLDGPIYGTARLSPDKTSKAARDKRLSSSKLSTTSYLADSSRTLEDSDSDLEDFHHIIADSRKAMNFTKVTLTKIRKDGMVGGIYLDPSEYTEPLATCQTNVRCLEEVLETIQSEIGLENVAEEDVQQVKGIIEQWQDLEQMAYQRQQQSQKMAMVFKDVVSLRAALQEVEEDLDSSSFEGVLGVEQCIRTLQENQSEMQMQHRLKMAALYERIAAFERSHPEIQMGRFHQEAGQLQWKLDHMIDRSVSRMSELQSVLFSWYDFNETHRELAYLLGQERHQLGCMELTKDLVTFTRRDVADSLTDLKAMVQEFSFYDGKLASLRQLYREVAPCCRDSTVADLREAISMMEHEMASIDSSVQHLSVAMEHRQARMKEEEMAMAAFGAAHADAAMAAPATDAKVSAETVEDVMRQCAATGTRTSVWWRILRAVLPLQLAIIALFGLLYILDPNFCDTYNGQGLVFSPQLRYVRGPPPI